jgi:4'-phosphopantetheinyl transferase
VKASGLQLELASLEKAVNWEPWLSREEARRAEGMANPVLRARFVVSRGLRRKVLAGVAGRDGQRPAGPAGPTVGKARFCADLEFVENEGTKPRLHGGHGWDFNLSHAGDYVALVVGRGEVGVDLEKIRPVREMAALVERYFHPDEARVWRGLPEAGQELAFFLLWSAREAAMKCLGMGLAAGLGKTRVDPGILESGQAAAEVGGRGVTLRQVEAPRGYVLVTAESVS